MVKAFDFLTIEIILILVVSNILHFFLQRLGQPSIISQILAGIMVGRTVLLNPKFSESSGNIVDYFSDVVLQARVVFMFIIGLEVDVVYLRQNISRACSIALASISACMALSLAASPLLYPLLSRDGASRLLFILTIGLFLSNSASPVLVCIATDLKLVSSKIGKLAISSAVVNDLTAVVAFFLYSLQLRRSYSAVLSNGIPGKMLDLLVWVILVSLAMLLMKWYISNVEVGCVLIVMGGIIFFMEFVGYDNKTMSFLLGLAFPRKGPTARTILDKLMFSVHSIILPLYFSGVFVNYNLNVLVGKAARKMIGIAFLVSFLSMAGKVIGTVAVTRFIFKTRLRESVVLGILLNAKGYMDIMFLSVGLRYKLWGFDTAVVLMFTIIINTFIACPVARLIVAWERRAYRYNPQSLEHLGPDNQLCVLACVHGQREVPAMLTLCTLCAGNGWSLIAVYLLHLLELTQKYAVDLMTNQKSLNNSSWENDGDDVRQVSLAADSFSQDSGLFIKQLTTLSSYKSMNEDIYMGAEEVRACLVLLPFHKEQRYDRRMVCRKDEKRQLNLKVLQHAPCTIGILVDRPVGSGMSIGMYSTTASLRSARTSTANTDLETPATVTSSGPVHQIVAIFFGGPDDREAASLLARVAPHKSVNATLVRFLPNTEDTLSRNWSSRCTSEFALITEHDMQLERDEQFLTAYQHRYVASGIVTYAERQVNSGPETVTALSSMAGMYSLFIVGKGGPHLSTPMMAGIRDWEECPELGPIGDLLASDDFMDSGSVLIMQQHKVPTNKSRIHNDILR
ncbi:Cation/H(+) antiporter [Rhynchospora pubera]|uniref:Cation/H(+) antiporter n=1 Tax=Rhynchospora pubera TaxID=906938 RepID=A0AAV8HUZ3_9POAL|nr:Cation/H(+) antiporter [Rhynchospora pubera]